jgi:hypothetical protein
MSSGSPQVYSERSMESGSWERPVETVLLHGERPGPVRRTRIAETRLPDDGRLSPFFSRGVPYQHSRRTLQHGEHVPSRQFRIQRSAVRYQRRTIRDGGVAMYQSRWKRASHGWTRTRKQRGPARDRSPDRSARIRSGTVCSRKTGCREAGYQTATLLALKP